jgi:hypothetical protein
MRNFIIYVSVGVLALTSACTQKVRQEQTTEQSGGTVNNNETNNAAANEQLNSIGIPMRLPYASDLEAYYLVNCKLNKTSNGGAPDPDVWAERGKIVSRLEAYEQKYKGKELEEYLKWGSVAANAINNCP